MSLLPGLSPPVPACPRLSPPLRVQPSACSLCVRLSAPCRPTRAQPASLDRPPDVRLWGCRGLVARNSHREMCSILGRYDDTGAIRQYGLPNGGQREGGGFHSIVSSPATLQHSWSRPSLEKREKKETRVASRGPAKERGTAGKIGDDLTATAASTVCPVCPLLYGAHGQSPIIASSQAAGTKGGIKAWPPVRNPCLAPGKKQEGEAPASSPSLVHAAVTAIARVCTETQMTCLVALQRPISWRRVPRSRPVCQVAQLPSCSVVQWSSGPVDGGAKGAKGAKAEGVKSDDLN